MQKSLNATFCISFLGLHTHSQLKKIKVIMDINDNNVSEVLSNKDKLIVLDCSATWCSPCQRIAPIIDDLSTKYQDKAIIGKCDIDENNVIVEKFNIKNVPTILYIKNGTLLDKSVGSQPQSHFEGKIEQYM